MCSMDHAKSVETNAFLILWAIFVSCEGTSIATAMLWKWQNKKGLTGASD